MFAFKINNVGIYKHKTNSYIPSYIRGVSDILGVLPDGRFLAIEVKTPVRRNNVSVYQTQFIESVSDANGIAFVAESVETVKYTLELYGYKMCDIV